MYLTAYSYHVTLAAVDSDLLSAYSLHSANRRQLEHEVSNLLALCIILSAATSDKNCDYVINRELNI
jgi:hypothetical protein